MPDYRRQPGDCVCSASGRNGQRDRHVQCSGLILLAGESCDCGCGSSKSVSETLVLKVTNCGNSAQQLSVSADQSHTGSSAGFIAINDSTKAQLQIGAPAGDGWTRETDGSYYNSTPTPANGNIDVSLSVTQSAATMPAPGDYTLPLTLKTKGA